MQMVPKSILLHLLLMTSISFAQNKIDSTRLPTKINQVVEVACGKCMFAMKNQKGCDLALMFKGNSYFILGTEIDEHGDAHAKDGFCNSIRKAKVKGMLVNNQFHATYFKLLPQHVSNK